MQARWARITRCGVTTVAHRSSPSNVLLLAGVVPFQVMTVLLVHSFNLVVMIYYAHPYVFYAH